MKKLLFVALIVLSLVIWYCNDKKAIAPTSETVTTQEVKQVSEDKTTQIVEQKIEPVKTQEEKPAEQKAPEKKVLSIGTFGNPIFADVRPMKVGKINYIATSKGLHTEKEFLQLAEDLKNEKIKSVIVRFLEDDTAIQITTGFMTTAVYGTFDKSTNGIGRTISDINFEKDSIKNMPKGILRK